MIYILTFLVSSAFVWIGTRECTKRKMEDGMWKTVRLKKNTGVNRSSAACITCLNESGFGGVRRIVLCRPVI